MPDLCKQRAQSFSVPRWQIAPGNQRAESASIHANRGLHWTYRDIDWTFLDKPA
jgi:hypothetical protein